MNYGIFSYGAYDLHIIKTDKFKTVKVNINFRTPVKKEEITIRNLLKLILLHSTNEFKTERELIIESEELYNLKLYATTNRVGNYSIMSFNLEFLNEKYTKKNLNQESLDFLMNILFKPNMKDNLFIEENVNKCKDVLKESIITERDNKTKYSIIKLLENMGDYPYSYNPIGYIEDLDKITLEDLTNYYKKLLSNDLIDILVVGDVDIDKTKKYFVDNFKITTYKKKKEEILLNDIIPRKRLNKIIEKENVSQLKMSIGLRVNNMTDFERKYVLRVYNEILGGHSGNSMLFDTIREKNSLAYYINSIPQYYDNVLIIYAGIRVGMADVALKIVKNTLLKMQKGKIPDELLKNAIKTIISAIKVNEDTPQGIINTYYAKALVNADDVDIKIKKYKEVTIEDVIILSKKIKLDTVLILEGDSNESD